MNEIMLFLANPVLAENDLTNLTNTLINIVSIQLVIVGIMATIFAFSYALRGAISIQAKEAYLPNMLQALVISLAIVMLILLHNLIFEQWNLAFILLVYINIGIFLTAVSFALAPRQF